MRRTLLNISFSVGVAVLFAVIFRIVFDIDSWSDFWSVMSITFFIALPYTVGIITIYLCKIEQIKSKSFSISAPFLPIFIFFFITILTGWEGWACWLMIMPVFLFFAALGGLTARYFRLKKSKKSNKLHISLVLLLPYLLAPVENMIGAIPGVYNAQTSIVINAPKSEIWKNVTRVKPISSEEDNSRLTNFLGFPRPIKAELNYEGVGAYRKAIFDKGLVFHETVKTYSHEQFMTFSISANTYEIPSTTLDEHILIGGDYFDVLEGAYALEKIDRNTFVLHLESQFKLSTTFNFYASIWAKYIMKDIQNNILQVIKKRSEEPV